MSSSSASSTPSAASSSQGVPVRLYIVSGTRALTFSGWGVCAVIGLWSRQDTPIRLYLDPSWSWCLCIQTRSWACIWRGSVCR
jgi:hypothetical protein